MKYKKKKTYTKTTGRLADNHTWKAPPGYKIIVIDRGAASFNFPAKWLVKGFEPLEIHDAEPPNDNARLMVTIWKFPNNVDYTDLPLEGLLAQATSESERDIVSKSEIFMPKREDLQIAWVEHRFIDPVEAPREAFSRIAVVRYLGIHLLITFDFWVDHAKRMTPVWDEVLRSLQMGRYIADPLKGDVMH